MTKIIDFLKEYTDGKQNTEKVEISVLQLNRVIKALENELCTLDDAREDFVFDVYNILNFLPTNNEANQIIDVFDRVTRGLEQESCEDAVSRKEIQQKINRLWNSNGDKDYCMETLRDFVTELSPVTPTRNKGKWIEVDTNMYTCSNCSYCFGIVPEVNHIQQFKCCPNCKTEMESEE